MSKFYSAVFHIKEKNCRNLSSTLDNKQKLIKTSSFHQNTEIFLLAAPHSSRINLSFFSSKQNTKKDSIVRILLEDNEALHDRRQRRVLFRGQLGSLAVRQQDRRGVSLESGDGFRFSGLPDNVHRLSDSDGDRKGTAVFVEGDEHARLDGRGQAVEKVVRLAEDGRLDVEETDDCREKSGDCDRSHQL